MATDRWIITSHKYYEHKSLAKAQYELERLRNENPKQKGFHILRIKTTLVEDKVDLSRKPRR